MSEKRAEENIATYIFSASIAMVGVCITAISILSIDPSLARLARGGDFLLSLDSLLFLISGILAYFLLREAGHPAYSRLIRITEFLFIAGLALTVLICIFLAYEYI